MKTKELVTNQLILVFDGDYSLVESERLRKLVTVKDMQQFYCDGTIQ